MARLIRRAEVPFEHVADVLRVPDRYGFVEAQFGANLLELQLPCCRVVGDGVLLSDPLRDEITWKHARRQEDHRDDEPDDRDIDECTPDGVVPHSNLPGCQPRERAGNDPARSRVPIESA